MCVLFIALLCLNSYSIINTYANFHSKTESGDTFSVAHNFFLKIKPVGDDLDDDKNLSLELGEFEPGTVKQLKNLLIFENITKKPLKVSWCFENDIAGFFQEQQDEILLSPYAESKKIFFFETKLKISSKATPGAYSGKLVVKVKDNYLIKEIPVSFTVKGIDTESVRTQTYNFSETPEKISISQDSISQSTTENVTVEVYKEDMQDEKVSPAGSK